MCASDTVIRYVYPVIITQTDQGVSCIVDPLPIHLAKGNASDRL